MRTREKVEEMMKIAVGYDGRKLISINPDKALVELTAIIASILLDIRDLLSEQKKEGDNSHSV